jgi:hypothetical protein
MSIFFLGLNFIETEKSFTKPKKICKMKTQKAVSWKICMSIFFLRLNFIETKKEFY